MDSFILALDQGTTSSRAIVFDRQGRVRAMAQQEFPQLLPRPGEVEHDPEAIWDSQWTVARQALSQAQCQPEQMAGIGITNQRETCIVWERDTGKPVHHAIVWQSRVSEHVCRRWRSESLEPLLTQKTGLLIDPYFTASKLVHLLETVDGLRQRAERGEVLFGTVDSFLIWKLTGGRVHVTDVSNASRTLLFNIHTMTWDEELLTLFEIPPAMLPQVVDSSGVLGKTEALWLGAEIPIAGVAGDQQAATFGQVCFEPGDAKNTYGTGCFLLMNTGGEPAVSQNRLLTTVGWRINGQTTYCLEGAVFIAGAAVQWLRDGLGLIADSASSETLARSVEDTGGVILVPAFVGLGAPYWDSQARGAMLGITRGTTAAHVARATLESIAFQSAELVQAMERDAGVPLTKLKVDGGASANQLLMQFQADLLGVPVRRPAVAETTALGAAYLAGLAVGYWEDLASIKANWKLAAEFIPAMDTQVRQQRMRQWSKAVQRSLAWED